MIVKIGPFADPGSGLAAARSSIEKDALGCQRAPEPLGKDVVREMPFAIHRDVDADLLQAVRPDL